MRKLCILLAFIIILSVLCSCHKGSEHGTIETTDVTQTQSVAETFENEISDDFYTITYSPPKAIENFDWSKTTAVDDVMLELRVPQHIVNTSGEYNSNSYMVYNEENQAFVRGFEFSLLIKVENDFVMKEDVYNKLYPWQEDIFLTKEYEMTKGTLNSGLEYVMFEKKDANNRFRVNIFVRLSDKYIISIDYSDVSEYYKNIFEIWNSITIKNK